MLPLAKPAYLIYGHLCWHALELLGIVVVGELFSQERPQYPLDSIRYWVLLLYV
uniref:Uncharacterized protein n=1 Tax=Setaria italica TaxID=4555 RepID=K4AN82_SETIT